MSETVTAPVSARARELLRDALVWDAHSGFWPTPDVDLENLTRWTDGGVDYLSIDVGFDVVPWTDTVLNLAAYRAWLAARPERFVLVETADDIVRAKAEGKLAITFDIEGAKMLAGQVSMVSMYYRLGVRQMLFAYNLNNEAAGGCHDDDQGLTDFGRAMLKEMNRVGMLVDLSHAGFRTSMELAERSTAPVIFSHANPKAMINHPRNITDEQMRAAVATGGIVGVNGVGRFVGAEKPTAEHLVRAIEMTVERVGAANVGFGLDYAWSSTGLTRDPKYWPAEHYPTGKFSYVPPSELPETVERLLRLGYKEADIRGILGENFLRGRTQGLEVAPMADTQEPVAGIMASVAYAKLRETLEREHERTVGEIITLTQIPSPPFGEEVRAKAYLEMLRAHGLADVEMDAIGNVMGVRRGAGNGPMIVVAAHLDTVFPAGTDVTVRREGTKLFAPGVGDDTRSLAVLLAFMRALDAARVRTNADILFVGDVGEEGLGDLRGVRHLFTEGKYRDRIKAFFTVDSPDVEVIAVGGIGSKRYHVTFRGPGGHSFGAFGIVNPLYAMGQAMLELSRTQVPAKPKTTFSASVVGGGTSINSIPNEVWMDIDLRSQSVEELARLEARFYAIVEQAAAAENHARSTQSGVVTAELKLVGDRPAGATPMESDLVRLATASIAAHGFAPRHEFSSTDANIPMSLGIPAIKIGSGGTGGRGHSLDEWIDVEKGASVRGMLAGVTAILAVAGVAP